ncbi:MAG: MFS transporter [Thermoanaerobaculia bacterium]|nr:MFS transporter [Thermoanaerobaculia bacterium]
MLQPTRATPAATTHAEPPRPPSARWALAALALSMLLAALGTSIANVALPTIAQEFAASFQAVQWVVLAYLLAVTTLIVGVGRLGDLFGRRGMLLAGIALFTLASIGCGVAPGLGWLIAARAVQGLGAAFLLALSLAFVGEVVPPERTGSAMGLLGSMSALGTALGPSLGGLLVAGPGWRAIFLLQAPLGLLAWWLARRNLPATAARSGAARSGFDLAGTLLLALALAAYALAMTLGRGSFGPLNLALILAAACLAALFVQVERRSPSPLVRLAMFREATLRAGLASSALVSTVIMATMVVGPFYLSRTLALDAVRVGLLLSLGPLVAALTAVPAGRIADRFGASRMTLAGLGAMAAGAAALALLPATLGAPGYLAPIVVVTAGYALFQTANNTTVLSNLAPDQRGFVSGLLNLSRNLGLITGASFMGAVFTLASSTNDLATAPPIAVAMGMRSTFAVAAVLIVVALGVTGRSRPAAASEHLARPEQRMAGFEAVGEELPVGARRAGALVGADIAAVAGGAVGDRREIDPAEAGPGVAVATLVAGRARARAGVDRRRERRKQRAVGRQRFIAPVVQDVEPRIER